MLPERGGGRNQMHDFILIFVTTSGREEAENIAMKLINSGSAPCINILCDVHSIYQWKGELVKDDEAIMIIKSRADYFEAVRDIVEANHSYDVPEILSVSIDGVSRSYASFLAGFLDG
jgi:periplasmic divalent cation tolerance protein